VISEPVLVKAHKNGAVSVNGKAENVNLPSDWAGQQDPQNQSIVDKSETSVPGQLGEDQAAVKAQAAFRGYLVMLIVPPTFLMHLQCVTHAHSFSLTFLWNHSIFLGRK
jgi:hypothetical protein